MNIYAIVAASENNVIGIGDELPWHLPDDFQFFKNTTLNHPIIMGKNTWHTFQKPLPKRLNIVISRTLSEDLPENVLHFSNIATALNYLRSENYAACFIIGGGMVYANTLNLVDKVYLTRVHTIIENGTAFFPELNNNEWQLCNESFHDKDERHEFSFTFQEWERVQKTTE